MCARFSVAISKEQLQAILQLDPPDGYQPRANVAPTQNILALRHSQGKRQLAEFKWGLVPSWAKDPSVGIQMINARSETVAEKPSFRSAFQHRRCAIIASGFIEWREFTPIDGIDLFGDPIPRATKPIKQPVYVTRKDGAEMWFAGLWETWRENLQTATIITCPPNKELSEIHDRMPVILEQTDVETWLDRPESALLVPPSDNSLIIKDIDPRISNSRVEGLDLLK